MKRGRSGIQIRARFKRKNWLERAEGQVTKTLYFTPEQLKRERREREHARRRERDGRDAA